MQKYRVRHATMIDDDFDSSTYGMPMYWHNEYGWTSYEYTKFTEEETEKFNLPDEGVWEKDGLDVSIGMNEADPFYVAVYEVDRAYGGAEEGGWWYDCGELVKVVIASSRDEAEAIRDKLREEYPNTGKRSSVLYGEDYDVGIETRFPETHFPSRTPYYS